jgi:hypothetical protein
MSANPERLYELLPAAIRVRDVQEGEPLRALLGVIGTEFDRIEGDVEGLYENWFIETCDEWVVPYIGDLLRVQPIHPVESAGVSTRAYVANTLAYRRRKGTATVLEQLARDVTGWPSRAVEFFQRLITTAHMNHVRLAPAATAGIRDAGAAELAGSPFEPFAHTAEMRRIRDGRGRYNISNVGLFLWRLQSYTIGRGAADGALIDYGTARRVETPGRPYFTVHPAGVDTQLFNVPITETTITHLAEEANVDAPLRPLALRDAFEAQRALEAAGGGSGSGSGTGSGSTTAPPLPLRVLVEESPGAPRREVPASQFYLCDLPDDVEIASPPMLAVAVDPVRGHLAFPLSVTPSQVFVSYSYGFPGDLGGGPYDRSGSIDRARFGARSVWQIGVSHLHTSGAGELVASLADAINAWHTQPPGTIGVIALMDSISDGDPTAGAPPLEIDIPEGSHLLIVAADWPLEENPDASPPERRFPGHWRADGVRAHVVGDLQVRGTAPASSSNPGALTLNGILLEGSLTVIDGHLDRIAIEHTTIVPDRGAITVEDGNSRLRLVLTRAIAPPIVVIPEIREVTLTDVILDGAGGSPDAVLTADDTHVSITRSTLFGAARVRSVDASESIFVDPIVAQRRQVGCVRFSYVPRGSAVPRRYRCQPAMAIASATAAARERALAQGATLSPAEEQSIADEIVAWLAPRFESPEYGSPAYAQLARRCPIEIRIGGDGGSEMGAWAFLEQPHREANLRRALDEYLPASLEAGVFFVT